MKKSAGGFFWGVLATAAALAIAGAVALAGSFRSSHAGGDPRDVPVQRKPKPGPARRKRARRQGKK
jgi:hypothetical protein